MPFIEDWATNPVSVIKAIFDESQESGSSSVLFYENVRKYFSSRIEAATVQIPSLNTTSVDELSSGSLVRYRCMIQDVFDPQYTYYKLRLVDSTTGNSRFVCGSYQEEPKLKPNERIDFDSRDNELTSTHSYYCVPIPGESQWVKEIFQRRDQERKKASCSSFARSKRAREDGEEQNVNKQTVFESAEQLETSSSNTNNDTRQQKSNEQQPNIERPAIITKEFDMNFPLPEETGISCIAKIFSSDIELKTTNAVELVGILSVNPNIASYWDDSSHQEDELLNKEEILAHEPPTSLVPRLHVIDVRHLCHNNPLLPIKTENEEFKSVSKNLMQDVSSLRHEMIYILEHALLGDSLCAEYMLCCLLSSVSARTEDMLVGNFTLNVTIGSSRPNRYVQFLYHLISQLTTQSFLFEMSIDNLNKSKLVPKKDYTKNRLIAGMLQQVPGAVLVVDETKLTEGQLESQGVANVRALGEMITWQKVNYDFGWHPIEIQTDIAAIVLSDETSLLPKGAQLRLKPSVTVNDVGSHFSQLDSRLTAENLDKLRCYLTVAKMHTYDASDSILATIQKDFVDTRQEDPQKMTLQDFHRHLSIVKLLTLSYGASSPTETIWEKAKWMDRQRLERLNA